MERLKDKTLDCDICQKSISFIGRKQKLVAESEGVVVLIEMNELNETNSKRVGLTGHKEERNQMGHPDLLLEQLNGSWGHY